MWTCLDEKHLGLLQVMHFSLTVCGLLLQQAVWDQINLLVLTKPSDIRVTKQYSTEEI